MPYAPTNWVDNVTDANAANMNHLEAGVAAAIPKDLVDAAGDLIVGSGPDAVVRLPKGADGQWLRTVGGAVVWAGLVDGEITRAKLATQTRKAQLSVYAKTIAGIAFPWPNAATNSIAWEAIVPDDYVSGDITAKIQLRSSVVGNQMRMQRNSYRFRDGVALNQFDVNVLSNLAISATLNASNLYSFTVLAANFQAGDILRFQIDRVGADAADTNTGDADADGAWIEYTGRA